MARWSAVGVVAALLLATVFAVTVWPTLYRYEVKHRCVFEPVGEPFENEYWGETKPPAKRGNSKFDFEKWRWEQRKDAGPWMRIVRMKIADELYQIHRISGDMYRLEKGRWALQGRLFEKPEEIMDGYNGKAPNGCHRSTEGVEQDSDYRTGPWTVYERPSGGKAK